MNKVQLSGNLVSKPELKTFEIQAPSGEKTNRKVSIFTLAVNITAGHRQENPAFVRCSAFGKVADITENNISQGDKVIVEGRLHPNNYKKGDVSVYTNDVIVDSIEFCTSKKNKTDSTQESNGDKFVDFSDAEEGLPLPI
jgi:single-strand DNA-binding protein